MTQILGRHFSLIVIGGPSIAALELRIEVLGIECHLGRSHLGAIWDAVSWPSGYCLLGAIKFAKHSNS